MKKVVFLNTNKAWGGGEKWHFTMAVALKQKSYDVSVIAHPESELLKKCLESKLNVVPFKTSNLSFINPFKVFLLTKILTDLKPDVVFLNLPIDVKICVLATRFLKTKLIYRRGMPHPIKGSFLNKIIYPKLNHFIANSHEIARSIYKNIPLLKDKTSVIYNGVIPLQNIEISDLLSEKKIVIGNLGRLVKQKGHHHFINIAKRLIEKDLSFEILIAGKGPLESELRQLINTHNLQDHIILCGHQNSQEFLKKIDIFAFTSHFEGSSNALIEAMQFGKPSICFNVSSMPEMIENNKHGFLISPFNEIEFADSILELSRNNTLYKEMVQENLKKVSHLFNQELKIKEVEELINE